MTARVVAADHLDLDIDVADFKFNLAEVLAKMGPSFKPQDSKTMYAEAAMFLSALGPEHPHTQMAQRNAAQ